MVQRPLRLQRALGSFMVLREKRLEPALVTAKRAGAFRDFLC
jgi:hypothetical protein